MPACLRELFEQTSSEQLKCFANNAHSSTKSFKSILSFNGMEFPPPLLTEDERAEMRQYRREAVKCEAKMFERRRERYSDLLLQVMLVMDRVQEQRETKTESWYDTEGVTERTLANGYDETTTPTFHRNNVQPASYEPELDGRIAWDSTSNGRNSKQEQFTKSYVDWTENNHHEHSSRVNSQLSYLPDSVESSFATSVDQRGMAPRNVNSRQQVRSAPVGSEGTDFPLSSTMVKGASELNRPFSQLSVASNGMFDPADTTMQNSSVSLPLERKVLGSDSLASTSLSMAFSDSSTSTVRSTIEVQPRPSTQQQQHHMDSATNDTHYRDYEEKQALKLAVQPQSSKTSVRPATTKQKTEKPKVQSSTKVSKGPSISEQDKTLANLEKLRQKLLEEKQKHLDALKQQELKRLRKQKQEQAVDSDHTYASFPSKNFKHVNVTERPRSSSLPSTRQSDFKQSHSDESESSHVSDRSSPGHRIPRTSPLRRPLSMPPGEMYSILELSGENLDLDTHEDHNTEPESSSDKENHVVEELSRGNRNDAVVEGASSNAMGRINSGQNIHPFPQRKEPKHFVPQEDNKLFESNGWDKFAKLSAHAKGFLTRCLMKTVKVQGLVKTIKDTRHVLVDISREEVQSVQEKKLKENVESHLRVAQSGLHDVFFKVPVKERMSYIAHSRALARAKETKRRVTRSSAAQSKLSAVTLKAIQRRQEDNSVTQTANSERKPKPEPREEKKKKTWNIRVLKPQQGHTSPPLPERTRSKSKQNTRPTTAPEKPLNSRLQKEDALKRPKTTDTARGNPDRPSRLSLGGGIKQPAKRPGRQSLGEAQQPMVTAKPRAQKRLSLPANAQPRIRGHTATREVAQRPKTASEVKRSSRTLAANFSN
ncbi:hypothetical protein ACROYT_G037975 [Oculina patagonica]